MKPRQYEGFKTKRSLSPLRVAGDKDMEGKEDQQTQQGVQRLVVKQNPSTLYRPSSLKAFDTCAIFRQSWCRGSPKRQT